MLAAILAGGYGKRLRPFTNDVPKPMVQIGDKPLIDWQIEWLKNYGFNEIILLVGYKKEKMIEHVGSGSKYGIRVTYVVEDEPLGTGGAVKNAEHILSRANAFLVVNGDIITNLDPTRLIEKLNSTPGLLGVIASIPLPSPYGVLEISGDRVLGFAEKPMLKDYWINAGVYALKPEALNYFPDKGDLEKTAFPAMAREGVLGTVQYENVFWKAIDTYKELEEASKILSEKYSR
ncbi:MAG: nucleotidyltransferase family protein [Thermosphaera sp.]